jgi:hypothetical protein
MSCALARPLLVAAALVLSACGTETVIADSPGQALPVDADGLVDPCALVDVDAVGDAVGETVGEPVEGKTGFIRLCAFSPEVVEQTFPIATLYAVDAQTMADGGGEDAEGFVASLLAEDPLAERVEVAGLPAVLSNGEWWVASQGDLVGASVLREDGPDDVAGSTLLEAVLAR